MTSMKNVTKEWLVRMVTAFPSNVLPARNATRPSQIQNLFVLKIDVGTGNVNLKMTAQVQPMNAMKSVASKQAVSIAVATKFVLGIDVSYKGA